MNPVLAAPAASTSTATALCSKRAVEFPGVPRRETATKRKPPGRTCARAARRNRHCGKNATALLRLRHGYPFGEVLLDVWVVRHYSGEPQALDGQALRWCTQTELESTELLPADQPIVAALRLPERLAQAFTTFYAVGDMSHRRGDGRLEGVFCSNLPEAKTGVGGGADFLVLRGKFSRAEVSTLCESVFVPVYVQGLKLEEAWALGA